MGTSTTPVAGRLRRPGWRDPRLLIGLVLIAVAVAGVTAIVRDADRTSPYWAARDTLPPGTVLGPDDVVAVDVRVDGDAYLPVTEEPWGAVIARAVGDGELLPAAALVDAADFDARPVAVPAALPLADDIGPGSVVDIYLTVDTVEGPSTSLVAAGLVVDTVDRDGAAFGVGASETVYVVAPVGIIADLLEALAADGDITVVGLGA